MHELIALIRKDISLLFSRGSALLQALLLGLILIFVFSLAQGAGDTLQAQGVACIFWLSSLFCAVLLFNQLFAIEETNGQRLALLLLPCPVQTLFLSKALSGLLLLLMAQLFFFPACVIFLGLDPGGSIPNGLAALFLSDIGLSIAASLLAALAQGQAAKESLLTLILFPLITPLLLAAISVHAENFGEKIAESSSWLSIALAFDAIFLSAALLLFPFIYSGDE